MATQLRMGRGPAGGWPEARLPGGLALACGRVHEACGPDRWVLAFLAAGALAGPVLWLHPAWQAERPNPDGLLPFFDPSRLILAAAKRAEDLLWSMEEALRSGAAPLVVADLPGPPALTPVRRLHLAAGRGAEATGTPPLGLMLTPGEGGAPGVESRWYLAPCHAPGLTRWRAERRRARLAPPAVWTIERRGQSWRATPAGDTSQGSD